MLSSTPDQIVVWTENGPNNTAAEVGVIAQPNGGLQIVIDAVSGVALTYVLLRWNIPLSEGLRVLGDHWERGYGDLEWRGVAPERVLPWYVLLHETVPEQTWGIGVETGASAFASWRVDESGITLVLDIRCGGVGVQLGGRRLHAATLHEAESESGETPFAFARRFCRVLCPAPRLTAQPVYGGNDWYFRYGRISTETVKQDSALIRDLSPSTENDPTFVIDAGWYPAEGCDGGPYDRGNERFPDMSSLAAWMRAYGIKPGIWIRPLLTNAEVPVSWRVAPEHPQANSKGIYLDPSVPEVLAQVQTDIRRLRNWGYGLIKHDFTTFDILGLWGFAMGQEVTPSGWGFADRTKTTAEIVRGLYEVIRAGADDASLIGCNTVGHLGAGLFELQRTGDDTSGQNWERTRKMGVNTLAYRMPQQGAFFASDADCVGLTQNIPWDANKLWLDLVARSGTPLFVSADPDAVGPEQRAALIEAFTLAAQSLAPAEPLDWMETTSPLRWQIGSETRVYPWPTFPGTSFACPA